MTTWRSARPLLARTARAYGSRTPDPTDEVLAYVRSGQGVSPDTAVDVLTSSLSRAVASPSSSPPLTAARLSLALAEVEAGRGGWRAAADAAGAAVEAACSDAGTATARSILAAAVDARLRACLTAGWDEEAAAAVESASTAGERHLPATAVAGWAALVAHAAGDAPGAASAAARVASSLPDKGDNHPGSDDPDAALATAWAALRAGAIAASCRGSNSSSTGPSPSHCLDAAAAASAASQSGADLATCPSGPLARGDLAASVSAATAQLALAARDFPGAEDAAAACLDSQAGPGRPPSAAAAPLLLLGDTFARRAQLTVAEGLYKRAAQGAGLVEPTGGDGGGRLWVGSAAAHPAVHPSLASAVAWRLAQLLTLAPRRSTEADRWAGVAVRVGGLGADAAALASALGPLDGLKGGTVAGMVAPCWVDVSTRRVFPRLGS